MRSKLIYWLVYSGMWLFSALPFRVLYMLSDLNCLLMYRIGKYRRRVVRGNLLRSFPEKTDAERLQIERKFYRYLSDYMLEDLKLLHMSAEELCARMTYKNTEQYLELTEKYGGIIVMIPHYANYEWLIGMGSIMKPVISPVTGAAVPLPPRLARLACLPRVSEPMAADLGALEQFVAGI